MCLSLSVAAVSAVVVYGWEYFYGGGIQTTRPGQTMAGAPLRKIDMGYTSLSQSTFHHFLRGISPRFTPATYSLLSHNCCAAGTLVALADGTSLPIERVSRCADVLSCGMAGGEREGLVVRQVANVLDQGVRQCVELLFSDGRTLTCTPDHPIRTADGRWVTAGALVVGQDEVAVGMEYPSSAGVAGDDYGGWRLTTESLGFDLDMSPTRAPQSLAFARLLGYLLTNGNVQQSGSVLHLGHQLDVEAVQRDMFLLTGTRPTVTTNVRTLQLAPPRPLHQAFIHVGAQPGERTKKVSHFPAFVMDPLCPLPVVREFLGGLFGGDGRTLALSSGKGAGGVRLLHLPHWRCGAGAAGRAAA